MTKKKPQSSQTDPSASSGEALRERAEEIAWKEAAQAPENRDVLLPEESSRLLHELRMYQIQLEMQNEELRRARIEQEALRERYFDLYDLAPVGYCTLSEKGLIQEVNLTAATLLGVARGRLVKQPLTSFILKEDHGIYYKHRNLLFETGVPQVCDLRMLRMDGALFWARLETTVAQDADGSRMCLAVIGDITERKRAEAKTIEYQAKLKFLTSQLTMADERLKRDVAAYVHDTLSQSLAMLKVNVGLLSQSVDDVRIKSALAEISDRVGRVLEEAQSLTCRLSYPALNVLGFEKAVAKWLTEEVDAKHGIAATFNDDGKVTPLDEDTQAVLFRGIRELVGNVVKHAGASRVDVSIRRNADSIVVAVKDNGEGFDPEQTGMSAQGGGFGILSIQEALEGLGGRLTIDSRPGKGCTVTLLMPLGAKAGRHERGMP